MFLKNKNIIFKIRRSKVTDYAALNVFFAPKAPNYEGVELMCQLNAMFALDQNVPDSFTNRIVGFILGETRAQSSSTHLCRETLVNKQLFKCV